MGKKLQSYDQLPELMKAEIAQNYPSTRRRHRSMTPGERASGPMKKIIDSRAERLQSRGITGLVPVDDGPQTQRLEVRGCQEALGFRASVCRAALRRTARCSLNIEAFKNL